VTGTQVVTTDKLESTVTYVTLVTVSVSVVRVMQAVVIVVAVAISVSTVLSDVFVAKLSEERTVLLLLVVECAVDVGKVTIGEEGISVEVRDAEDAEGAEAERR
jgi:hypothetical protein